MRNLFFSLAMIFSLVSAQSMAASNTTKGTIVDIAVATPELSTLVTALEVAGLVDDLEGPGPFTVFAPTNDAFNALPDGVLDELLANPDALKEVLLYHVASGRKFAKQLARWNKVTTLQGQKVKISVIGGSLYINNAKVIITDIIASNGVIHVIDAVLIPPTK